MPARVLIAEPLLERGMAADAAEHLEAAAASSLMERDPVLALRTGLLLPRALREVGRTDDALRVHDRFRSRFPRDPDLLAEGPHLALAAGHREAARRRLADARSVAPSHPRVVEAATLLRD
jgi:Flp pilus assembly protein TadD